MPFPYHPHRHVKVWLSDKKNVFMNIENQIRLIRMRATNPNDEINLVYDSSLLSKDALDELKVFCIKHNIAPVDMQKDVIPACQTEEEFNLITIYHDEIKHLDQGGNLAAAKDILQWLGPVYRLGTYTDFDVEVDTRKVPANISVETPLLFNIGSIQFSDIDTSLLNFSDIETPILNNDTVAIVDSIIANETIKKIQQSIYKNCIHQEEGQSPYKHFIDRKVIQLQNLSGPLGSLILFYDPTIVMLKFMADKNQQRSVREFRHYILESTVTNDAFLKFEEHENKLHEYAAVIRSRSSIQLPADDRDLVTFTRKKTRFGLLKNSVVFTTGPSPIAQNVFPQFFYHVSEMDAEIFPYAFAKYGLEKIFQSKNSLPIHATHEVLAKLLTCEPGENNDISWLPEGAKAQKKREIKMEKSALIIQSFFRSYQVRKELGSDISREIGNDNDSEGVVSSWRVRGKFY